MVRLVVGVLDIGPTCSTWGFSFGHEFESDPTKVHIKKWNDGYAGIHDKSPTCILIAPDKTFQAFGYDARDQYIELTNKGLHNNYYFFQKFRTQLLKRMLGEKYDCDVTIDDETGKSLPAMLVFSLAIAYLWKDMFACASHAVSKINMRDIHWVLCVPSKWTETGKQFMRMAAQKAGIDDDRLSIALDHEAAFTYWCHSPPKTPGVSTTQFKPGTNLMIIDAEDNIDVTIHDVTSTNYITEVQPASGGPWGSVLVDKAFEGLLVAIFTRGAYETIKKTKTEDWLDIWRRFEQKKKTFDPSGSRRILFDIPPSLYEKHERCTGMTIDSTIACSRFSNQVEFHRGQLKLSAEVFRGLFDESIQKTVDHIESILNEVNLKAILMVGKLAEANIFQCAMKARFAETDISFVIPQVPATAILQGALIYAHSQRQ